MGAMAEGRLIGIMKWFDPRRGYGWVKCDAGEFFAHVADFRGDFEPVTGDEVSFVLSNGKGGKLRAADVEILGE
jgi:cold shock CspA family protein